MTTLEKAARMALEALSLAYEGKCRLDTIPNATEALRAALEQKPCNPSCAPGYCYCKEMTEQPKQEPVALLLQLRSALALASAICDAVPSRQSGHLGTLVNAQPDGSHGYHQIQDAEAALVKYLAAPAAPPSAQPAGKRKHEVS